MVAFDMLEQMNAQALKLIGATLVVVAFVVTVIEREPKAA